MHARRTPKPAGFTLIEVLVTIVILSVGLLGMAALQITGVRSATGATSRTQATLLIDDIVERMRANPTAVDADAFAAVNSTAINCAATPNPYCGEYTKADGTNGAATACTSAQMAAFDINVWFCGESSGGSRRGGVTNVLTSATATITCDDTDPPTGADTEDCTNRSPHIITIGWTENRPEQDSAGTATTTQSISMTIQP